MAIGRPPAMGIDKTTAVIHKQLASINAEALVELHKRARSIYELVDESHNEITELRKRNMEQKSVIDDIQRQNEELSRRIEGMYSA
jgi:hypothetical protein